MLLSGEDPASRARSKANSMAISRRWKRSSTSDTNWNIIAYPSASWAKQVFSDDAEDVAVAKLADAILRGLAGRSRWRVAAWRNTMPCARANKWSERPALSPLRIPARHGPDHWMADGHEWVGGASTAKTESPQPNIPNRRGFHYAALPASRARREFQAAVLSGTLIDNIP